MTEEYVENDKVFGRWQSRMLETHEAALSSLSYFRVSAAELDLGCFRLNVSGGASDLNTQGTGTHLNR